MRYLNLFLLITIIGVNAIGSNLSESSDKVQAWVRDLPTVSSLNGDKGCQAISFPQSSVTGIIALKLDDELIQSWLGLSGKVTINEAELNQVYSGGGIDGFQYKFSVTIRKESGHLTSLHYRYWTIKGIFFKKETLLKEIVCDAK